LAHVANESGCSWVSMNGSGTTWRPFSADISSRWAT
jgi:hypothetical protein